MPRLVTGSSKESLDDAFLDALRQIPGDPAREGMASADITRIWMTNGGIVGPMFHVEMLERPA